MVSVATFSDLLGMLKAGNLELQCLHMGYLMEATPIEWSVEMFSQ